MVKVYLRVGTDSACTGVSVTGSGRKLLTAFYCGIGKNGVGEG